MSPIEITFNILSKACEFNGPSWKDSHNCNHKEYSYPGEITEDGYTIRSDQPCTKKSCPFLGNEILRDGNGDILEEGDFVKCNPEDDWWFDIVISVDGRLILASELRGGEIMLREQTHGTQNPCIKHGNIHSTAEIKSWKEVLGEG